MHDPRGFWGGRPTASPYISAVRPWRTADARRPVQNAVPCDDQAEIDRCLNCPLPSEQCRGLSQCSAPGRRRRTQGRAQGRPPKLDRKAARRYYDQGLSDVRIGKLLQVSSNSVRYWRTISHLPPNCPHTGRKPCE